MPEKIKSENTTEHKKFINGDFKDIVNRTIEFQFSKMDGTIIDLCLNISELILNGI